MTRIVEAYGRIGDPDDRFDIDFWQNEGPEAIFQAALDLIQCAQLVREGHVDEPRLQRDIEHFQRL
ncbi:MAG TPA: hypothetical protein PLB62_15110 [Candidatus Sumerlaeota bacterium]|nr:hypothetical protein [Candidatus Sumerlaeota bacterium]